MNHFRISATMIVIAASALLALAARAHEGHEHATGLVKDRMESMTDMDRRLKAITRRVKANKDLSAVAGDAHVIHELADKLVSQFPPGSTQHPTAAKPAIWQDWQDFENKAKALETEAGKLMNTNGRDVAAIAAQSRALAQACDNCHEIYRRTK